MCGCKAREGLPVKNGIRMSDIAKELGVSVVTVSNALNDRGGVSEEMRRRVKTLASELGYRPSAPRTPRKTVSAVQEQGGSIGILTSQRFADVRGTFYWFLTAGVSKELTNCNLYSVYESVSEEDERNCVLPRIVTDRQVRGLIVVGQLATGYLERLTAVHIPTLFLDFYDQHSGIDSVVSDNYYDSYLMTEQLVSLGHKRIGFIGTVTATSSIHDRFLGYIKCLMEHRIPYEQKWTLDDRGENGLNLPEIAFPEDDMPTAFVCNCDDRVPRDRRTPAQGLPCSGGYLRHRLRQLYGIRYVRSGDHDRGGRSCGDGAHRRDAAAQADRRSAEAAGTLCDPRTDHYETVNYGTKMNLGETPKNSR